MKEKTTISCPFCDESIEVFHYPSTKTKNMSSSVGGRTAVTWHISKEKYEILSEKCPNCGKSKKEIEKVLRYGESKPISHQTMLERLKKAGLPTRV